MIYEVDEIRLESVQDRRFLGKLKRRWKFKIKAKTIALNPRKEKEKKL